jgi:hypothetical protein
MAQVSQNLPGTTLGQFRDTWRSQTGLMLGGPGVVGTDWAIFEGFHILIQCVVAEEVGKGAIMLQQC